MIRAQQTSNLDQYTFDITQKYLQDLGHAECQKLLQQLLAEAEKGIIRAALEHTNGNQSNTAKLLGITRTTLRTRLTRYDLN